MICLEGKSITLHRRGHYSHQFLPTTHLTQPQHPQCIFKITRCTLRALQHALSCRLLLPELIFHKKTPSDSGIIIDLQGGQRLFSPPPVTPSSTLEELFELTLRPSRAQDLPRALFPEHQRYQETVRCAVPGTEVPRYPATENLSVRLLKAHLFSLFHELGGRPLGPLPHLSDSPDVQYNVSCEYTQEVLKRHFLHFFPQ